MYVNGQWSDAEGRAAFDVVNPATREVVARCQRGLPETRLAIDGRSRRVPRLGGTVGKERGRSCCGSRRHRGARDDIARLIFLENGKPFEEAQKEVSFAVATRLVLPRRRAAWEASGCRRPCGQAPVGLPPTCGPCSRHHAMEFSRHHGHAPDRPRSGSRLYRGAQARLRYPSRAGAGRGLPRGWAAAGVFNVLTTNRSALVRVNSWPTLVSARSGFTGSTEVGKWIMEHAARQLKRLSFRVGWQRPLHRLRRL